MPLGEDLYQLRLEQPLIAMRGDRVVVRSIAPVDTIGGGQIIDPHARRHGASPEALARLSAIRRGEDPVVEPPQRPARPHPVTPPLTPTALEVERQLREAGHEPPADRDLDVNALVALRQCGRATRIGRTMHIHPDALAEVETRLRAIANAEGHVTLARLRDELRTSRRYALALLDHFDSERITIRHADDTRTLRIP